MTATTDSLIAALNSEERDRTAAGVRIAAAATRALAAIMEDRGWIEVQVDVESRSRVDGVTLADGTVVEIDFDDEQQAHDVVGNCARSLFLYRDGEYRATLDEVRAAAQP